MSASLRVRVRPYNRPFRRPLPTSRGVWRARAGAIVRLGDEARVGWGEIAPLPEFGSESLAAALEFCQALGETLPRDRIFAIPDDLPACQFAFESALAELEDPRPKTACPSFCYLLPTGAAAIGNWSVGWALGARTFKWKIGVAAPLAERRWFAELLRVLPARAQLRLDANGGLDRSRAEAWLAAADGASGRVEFCEQLLPPERFGELQALAAAYQTPLALDESVATLAQLQACHARGWQGIYVIKPAIVGSPRRLRQFFGARSIDAVFSSAFEGEIGRRAALRLAADLGSPGRAVGFGVTQWLEPESFLVEF